jgi:ABC-type phosphonate transport system ATPase subunit
MSKKISDKDAKWLQQMTELEKERGDLLPNGFAGGVVALRKNKTKSAALRARDRVRFPFLVQDK